MAEKFRVADNDYVDPESILKYLDSAIFGRNELVDIEDKYSDQIYYGDGVLVEYGTDFRVERADVENNPTVLWTAQGGRNELIVGGDMDDRIYTELIESGGIEGWFASHFADYEEVKETIQLDEGGRPDRDRMIISRSPSAGLQTAWKKETEEGGIKTEAYIDQRRIDELDFDIYLEAVDAGLAIIPLHDDVTVTVEETYSS